jgi:uncharacterized protein (UPF0333 family)
MNKRGGLHWEYLVAIMLVLLVVILGLMFLKFGREVVVEKVSGFFNDFLKLIGR